MIQEDYVSVETAVLMAEKGFNTWEINGTRCTLGLAMKWLREVHNLFIEICMDRAHNFKDIVFRPAIYDKELDCLWESDNFSTYEQACEAAIKHCLEHLI